MNITELRRLSPDHQRTLLAALAADTLFAPVRKIAIDRATGDMRVQYLRSQVQEEVYLPLFSEKSYWESLKLQAQALMQPPLRHLRASLGNIGVVVDLGSEAPFTATLDVLLSIQGRLSTSSS